MADGIARIISVERVIHGVLKIEWNDGYAGVADLRPVISRGGIFVYLQDETNFGMFRIGDYGYAIVWTNDAGEEIDFGTESLRQRAERQAELLRGRLKADALALPGNRPDIVDERGA